MPIDKLAFPEGLPSGQVPSYTDALCHCAIYSASESSVVLFQSEIIVGKDILSTWKTVRIKNKKKTNTT